MTAPPEVPGRTAMLSSHALGLAIGALGGGVAVLLGLPLPWLIGSLIATAAFAIAGVRPFGAVLAMPHATRVVTIPVIGVAIGSAVTPDILSSAAGWIPSILALLIYIPLAHVVAFTIARRIGRIDRVTAYYGTMPGGFFEAISMGDAAGADVALLSVMQFLRLILCIVCIPIGFTIITGEAVGSASGKAISEAVLDGRDWVLLFASGIVGAVLGRALRLPAWVLTGPLLISGFVHVVGWVEGGPPQWLIGTVQLLVGSALGARFAGREPAVLLKGARIAAISVSATLMIAAAAAGVLPGLVGEKWQAVFLAFAPGGLAEMSLIALSLEVGVIYVTVHHILRIVLSVIFAQIGARWVLRPET